jgi:hypothetical protein
MKKTYFLPGSFVWNEKWATAHLYKISSTERGHKMMCGKMYKGLLGYAPRKMKVCELCLAKNK